MLSSGAAEATHHTARLMSRSLIDQFGAALVEAFACDGQHRAVRARVALHADRVDRQQPAFGEPLDGMVGVRAQAADRQAGAGEGMAVEQRVRQAQFAADRADFVFVERSRAARRCGLRRSASEFRRRDCDAS